MVPVVCTLQASVPIGISGYPVLVTWLTVMTPISYTSISQARPMQKKYLCQTSVPITLWEPSMVVESPHLNGSSGLCLFDCVNVSSKVSKVHIA